MLCQYVAAINITCGIWIIYRNRDWCGKIQSLSSHDYCRVSFMRLFIPSMNTYRMPNMCQEIGLRIDNELLNMCYAHPFLNIILKQIINITNDLHIRNIIILPRHYI